jgi:hypothetical protein
VKINMSMGTKPSTKKTNTCKKYVEGHLAIDKKQHWTYRQFFLMTWWNWKGNKTRILKGFVVFGCLWLWFLFVSLGYSCERFLQQKPCTCSTKANATWMAYRTPQISTNSVARLGRTWHP